MSHGCGRPNFHKIIKHEQPGTRCLQTFPTHLFDTPDFVLVFQSFELKDTDLVLLIFYRTDAIVSAAWKEKKVSMSTRM